MIITREGERIPHTGPTSETPERIVLDEKESNFDDRMRPDAEYEAMLDPWNELMAHYDKNFELVRFSNEWPEARWTGWLFRFISNQPHRVLCKAGEILEATVEACKYEETRLPGERTISHIRRVHTYTNEHGQKMGWTQPVRFFDFIAHFRPLHFSATEWEHVQKSCEAIAAREKAIWDLELAEQGRRNKQNERAALERTEPQSALAAGISAGIAEALSQLGVVGKKGAAK